jgi:glycosyltransferase involved in cell wall biosynthesis
MAASADNQIAFVVQRYGLEVNGGAELLCRQVAEHLTAHYRVHVLTSCALDYITWKNHYRAGIQEINGVQVHRFPVDKPRNPRRFRRLTQRLLACERPFWDQLEWMRQQGPFSTPLFDFIRRQRGDFGVFVFFTYLYPTTYFGLPLAPEKAALAPLAHDEPFLSLDLFRPLFHLPRYIIYSTDAERRLVQETFANAYVPGATVGIGIEIPEDVSGERFRREHALTCPFILYVGRIDNAKNCPELFDHFIRFKREHPGDLKLVLMGRAVIPVPKHPDILPLGYVSESEKFDGMAAAAALVVPSLYESLSIVTLEAWGVGTPVLVNGRCSVLRESCEKSEGGLCYYSYDEYAHGLRRLLSDPDLRGRSGQQGAAYVARHYRWPQVERRYQEIIEWIKESK